MNILNFLKKCFNSINEFYEEKENSTFIDFLTGFRGTLALSVICHHVANHFISSSDISLFKRKCHWYGVYGFFFLAHSFSLIVYIWIYPILKTQKFK